MKVLRLFLVQLSIFALLLIFALPSVAAEVVLQVNPSKTIAPFAKEMLGVGLVNWDHSWGKPFPGQVPGLAQAYKAAHIKLIRYAGGLWANSVGFDRTPQKTPTTEWTKNGMTYYFNYGTNEIDSLAQLATQAGADVMIQVNISNNDPAMWADMVKYTNKEKGYNFKYWELGNELDSDADHKISATTYYQRVQQYQTAMLAVDPTIKILAGVPAFPVEQIDAESSPLSGFVTQPSPGGKNLGGISWHWYQACNTSRLSDITQFSWDSGLPTNSWRNAYTRSWSGILPARIKQTVLANYPSVKQGVTELNVDACNYNNVYNANHIAAIWFSDVIGRLAYNGIDYVTMYTGFGIDGYSILYPDNETTPTKIMARPTFYPLLMYGRYFGDSMVESSSANGSVVSVWASKDSTDPNTVKLMVTNMSSASVDGKVILAGIAQGQVDTYQLTSSNPTDTSATSVTSNASTAINGKKIDAMNVNASFSQIQPVIKSLNDGQVIISMPAYSTTAIIIHTSGVIGSTPTPIPSITPSTSPSSPPGCTKKSSGDANCDGIINLSDFEIYRREFTGITSTKTADFDGSGTVNIVDFEIFRRSYLAS